MIADISLMQRSLDTLNSSKAYSTEKLSLNEELRLGGIIQKGGKDAEDAKWKLVFANVKFLAKVIIGLRSNDEETQQELLEEAIVKAYRATEKFNPSKGRRFVNLIGNNLAKELLADLSIKENAAKISAQMPKLVDKYNKLNKGREDYDVVCAEEFAKIEGIKVELAKDIILYALCEEGNIRVDDCYKLTDDYTDDDCTIVNEEQEIGGSYTMSSCGIDDEVMLKNLDSLLYSVLKTDEKVYIWKSRLGIDCQSKNCKELALELGKSDGAVRHMFENSSKKVKAAMPQELYLALLDYIRRK